MAPRYEGHAVPAPHGLPTPARPLLVGPPRQEPSVADSAGAVAEEPHFKREVAETYLRCVKVQTHPLCCVREGSKGRGGAWQLGCGGLGGGVVNVALASSLFGLGRGQQLGKMRVPCLARQCVHVCLCGATAARVQPRGRQGRRASLTVNPPAMLPSVCAPPALKAVNLWWHRL